MKHNIINKKFNRLLVLEQNKDDKSKFKCLCDCGIITYVSSYKLRNDHTKSCGCLVIDNCKVMYKKKKPKYPDPKIYSAKAPYRRYLDKELTSEQHITFDQFLELSAKNCHYCNSPPSNKHNQYLLNKSTKQEMIDKADFIYNRIR